MSDEWVTKINEKLYNFLWKGKCDKVKRKIVMQDVEKGGLNVTDLAMCIKAVRIKWIKKYINCKNDPAWKKTFEFLCNKENLNLFITSNFDTNELPVYLPLYHKESFKFWKDIKCETVEIKQDLNNQILWYNKNVKVNNHTVFSKSLFQSGLWNVNDLYKNGELISFDIWFRRGASVNDYLVWRGIIEALPFTWKELLKDNTPVSPDTRLCYIDFGNKITYLNNLTERHIKEYEKGRIFSMMEATDFKAKTKYENDYALNEDEWVNIYTIAFDIVIDNKIIEMQFYTELLVQILCCIKLERSHQINATFVTCIKKRSNICFLIA